MFLAPIIFNIGDLVLVNVGIPASKVRFIREFWPLLFFIAPIFALILCARGILPGTRQTDSKPQGKFWIYVSVTSVMIHALFCIQAFLPLREGGMVSGVPWLLIFCSQYTLDFFLPPEYPLNGDSINYFHFWGKMLVAFPASLADGLLLIGCGSALRSIYKPSR